MDQQLRDRLSWWHLKAKRETEDHWIRFVLYYLILDAYMSDGSGSGKDEEKLVWFIGKSNPLRDTVLAEWNGDAVRWAKALKSISPVSDMRPGSTKSRSITDENSLEEVIRFIYQIRCNLFHGSKDLTDPRDSKLVDYGASFLKVAIDCWLAIRPRWT